MTTSTKKSGLMINVKAGGLQGSNHNRALAVRSNVKAGGLQGSNHNRALAV
jgi:hypothetical protein